MGTISAILAILGPLLKIVGSVIGDYYMAKLVTAIRVWWRKFAWESLKTRADEDFKKIEAEWADLNQDRPDNQRPTP